jgi:DNA-binding Lrp family transcriptional regulator
MIQEPLTKPTKDNEDFDIVVIKLADSKIPVFKESKTRNYIKYGIDNDYPDYLTGLFNKSAKHNAILNGKSFYIFGKGFSNGNMIVNRLGESLNDVAKKCILDVEVYGGFRLEIIYNRKGLIAEIYHVSYTCIRLSNDGNYYFKEKWEKYSHEEDATWIAAFNSDKPYGNQIFAYNEYRPDTRFYPLPNYIGCNNYIETDIEISKYYLSAIKNGMNPSKIIQFFEGEPTSDKKQEIESRFKRKFAGSENAGNIILVFSKDPNKKAEITDISATDLDKQFIEMNKTVQQEIFSGHLVTSPMLFGIKTEGQLGGNNELSISYSLFQNTYAKPKAENFSKEIEWLLSFSIFRDKYELQPTDPVGNEIDIKDVIDSLPKQFVFEKLGIPEDLWNATPIGADNKPAAVEATPGITKTKQSEKVNDVSGPTNSILRNLSGRQQQQLERLIKKYKKGSLDESTTRTLLKSSLGLKDDEINSILGIQLESNIDDEDEIIAMFDACGDARDDFDIVKSKKVSFSAIAECLPDEEIYIKEAFTGYDVTATEAKILELIKKDSKITPQVIATTINQSESFVKSKIDSLIKRGYLESSESAIGEDIIIERLIPKGIDISMPDTTIDKKPTSKIFIRYSYEGPRDDRNRPFCAKMLDLNRLYSRADIEKISERLGYSVFDRRGGFWRHKDKTITPWCRHDWKSNIVIQK